MTRRELLVRVDDVLKELRQWPVTPYNLVLTQMTIDLHTGIQNVMFDRPAAPAFNSASINSLPDESTAAPKLFTSWEVIYPSTTDKATFIRTGFLFNSHKKAQDACKHYSDAKVIQVTFHIYE